MADFIDFMVAASVKDGNELYNTLLGELKKNQTPKDLLNWFHNQNRKSDGEPFNGISLQDCEKLYNNKDGFIEYGNLMSVKNGY